MATERLHGVLVREQETHRRAQPRAQLRGDKQGRGTTGNAPYRRVAVVLLAVVLSN